MPAAYEEHVYIDGNKKVLYVRREGAIQVAGSAGGKILPESAIQPSVSDPSGGATQDAEARTAIAAIIDALQGVGILRS